MKSVVAVSKTRPETVIEDYATLLDNAKLTKALPRSKETILKLNLSWTLYYPACSTQPWQLESTLDYLKNKKYKNLHPVENSTVVTDVWQGAKLNKWLPVLKDYNLPFEPLTETEWVPFKPKANLLALDKIFPNDYRIPKMFLNKNVIHFPTIKTHGHTTMTGAMKNAFGGLITKRRHHCHKAIHEVIVDLLQIQKEIHTGTFAITDGTVAGDGKGPRTMIPRIKNTILASEDQVAIDAISAKLMGFNPMKIKFIKLAHDMGLGCGDVDQIDVVGEDITKTNFNFQTGKSPVIFFDQLFRKKLQSVEKVLFHSPLFKTCIAGSAIYHDAIWYNTTGKRRINKFMKTPWGRLFQSYK